MILTVTPDPALDRVLLLASLTPGLPMHARSERISVGGKGLDASVALAHLGVANRALCMLAGRTGDELQNLVRNYGIDLQAVWVSGETRTATILAEEDSGRHSHIFSGGLRLEPEHVDAFLRRFEALLGEAEWIITGGKLPEGMPADLFRSLARTASEAGVPVLVDAHSRFVQPALQAAPQVVKMNRVEFAWTFGEEPEDLAALSTCMQAVRQRYALHALVVTCGADGILAWGPEGGFRATAPPQRAVNAAGAGDAASAALAWRLSCGDDWPEALRWAAAAGAAVALTPGTADLEKSAVLSLLEQVRLEVLVEKME